MKKKKLNYQFHNPNTAEATADMVLKVMIEANAGKVEEVIREAAEQFSDDKNGMWDTHHSTYVV